MYDGKEKRRELINELRSTHALQNAEMTLKRQEKNIILQQQRQEKLDDQYVSVEHLGINKFFIFAALPEPVTEQDLETRRTNI